MDSKLMQYIEEEIIPRYDSFDAAHRRNHVLKVIHDSMELASRFGADEDMAFTIAAYHDLGLAVCRKTHHIVSGEILRGDTNLRRWFSPEQIETMVQAVEDHRASSGHEPRTIYGRIVAEADRCLDPQVVITRTVQYGLSHYSELSRDEQVKRTVRHLNEKYGPHGYLKLWISSSENERLLQKLQNLMADEPRLVRFIGQTYDSLVSQTDTATDLDRQSSTIQHNKQ